MYCFKTRHGSNGIERIEDAPVKLKRTQESLLQRLG